MQQQFEHERGGDLVRQIGHADVEEGEVTLQDITDDYLEFLLQRGALHALLKLGYHSEEGEGRG